MFITQPMSDKLRVWAEIKRRAPDIIKEGGNPIDLLLWSQGKTLGKKHENIKKNNLVLLILIGFLLQQDQVMKKLDDANFEVDHESSEDVKLKKRSRKKVRADKKTNFHQMDCEQNDSDSEFDENDIEDISINEEDEMKIRTLVKSDETVIEDSLLFDH